MTKPNALTMYDSVDKLVSGERREQKNVLFIIHSILFVDSNEIEVKWK